MTPRYVTRVPADKKGFYAYLELLHIHPVGMWKKKLSPNAIRSLTAALEISVALLRSAAALACPGVPTKTVGASTKNFAGHGLAHLSLAAKVADVWRVLRKRGFKGEHPRLNGGEALADGEDASEPTDAPRDDREFDRIRHGEPALFAFDGDATLTRIPSTIKAPYTQSITVVRSRPGEFIRRGGFDVQRKWLVVSHSNACIHIPLLEADCRRLMDLLDPRLCDDPRPPHRRPPDDGLETIR